MMGSRRRNQGQEAQKVPAHITAMAETVRDLKAKASAAGAMLSQGRGTQEEKDAAYGAASVAAADLAAATAMMLKG